MKDTYHIDQNPHKGNRGLVRAWHAAKNSWRGLVFAFKEESAFRQELTLFVLLTPIALVLPVSLFEKEIREYQKGEEVWLNKSQSLLVSPYITRCLWWDLNQGQENSRYWSYCLENQLSFDFCG